LARLNRRTTQSTIAGLLLLLLPGIAFAGSEAVVRPALEALGKGRLPDSMTPETVRGVETELNLYLRDTLGALGALKSLYGMGPVTPSEPFVFDGKPQKLEQFQAIYERGWIQWRVFIRPDGKIGRLVPFSINAPGTD
jgi:hypothetical protein